MKHFIGFLKKEFYHIFRDKRTLGILFGMPIALMMLFGYVITTEVKDARIAILDQSKDETTRKIIEKIADVFRYFLINNSINYLSKFHVSTPKLTIFYG